MGWIKVGLDYPDNWHLVAFGYGEKNYHKAYQVWLQTDHKYEIDQYGMDDEASGIHDLPINTWFHVAAMHDENNNNINYQNGENVGEGIDTRLETGTGAK
jgi:hypothetical protein